MERAMKIYERVILRDRSHYRNGFTLEIHIGAYDSEVLPAIQWSMNPARELWAEAYFPPSNLLEAQSVWKS